MFVSGSTPNVNSIGEPFARHSEDKPATYGEMIVEKIHGIGEKLLGHHRSDSDCSTRGKTGEKHKISITFWKLVWFFFISFAFHQTKNNKICSMSQKCPKQFMNTFSVFGPPNCNYSLILLISKYIEKQSLTLLF